MVETQNNNFENQQEKTLNTNVDFINTEAAINSVESAKANYRWKEIGLKSDETTELITDTKTMTVHGDVENDSLKGKFHKLGYRDTKFDITIMKNPDGTIAYGNGIRGKRPQLDFSGAVTEFINIKYILRNDGTKETVCSINKQKLEEALKDAEKDKQLKELEKIKMRGHKIAYKVNGERKYCAYDNGDGNNDWISTYNSNKEVSRRNNNFSDYLYDKIDLIGPNYCNLQNETYKSINAVRNAVDTDDHGKVWAIDNYTSKGAWTDANKEILYDWCKAGAESFLSFCERLSNKCNINRNKITIGTWMTMKELRYNTDRIEDIVIK